MTYERPTWQQLKHHYYHFFVKNLTLLSITIKYKFCFYQLWWKYIFPSKNAQAKENKLSQNKQLPNPFYIEGSK